MKFLFFVLLTVFSQNLVWPIGKKVQPDLPQSNCFGPRIKVSEGKYSFNNLGNRYDWHRGVDIPTPYNSSVYSIADGVVRLAGNYSNYEDTVIQINHKGITNKGLIYSNYLHMFNVYVKEGENVTVGQLIGTSGKSVSNFEHLHFELREFGVFQKNCISPWKYLPFNNTDSLSVDSFNVTSKNISLEISVAPRELDFNAFIIEFLDNNNNVLPNLYRFNIENITLATENYLDLDEPFIPYFGVKVSPRIFSYQGNNPQRMSYNFFYNNTQLPVDAVKARVTVIDVLKTNKSYEFNICPQGFTSPSCSIPICNEIPASNTTVCSGRGSCVSPNTCSCTNGYYGFNCNFFTCFNIAFNDSKVCSSRGKCINFNQCNCNLGYGGSQCEFNDCYGKLSNDPTVCSSNGQCSSPNSCSCKTGFLGTTCNLYTCQGNLFNESTVCNSKGKCISLDICSCDNKYNGTQCEDVNCFKWSSKDPNVCSSRGKCTLPDKCTCDNGFIGEQCQFLNSNRTNTNGSSGLILSLFCLCFSLIFIF